MEFMLLWKQFQNQLRGYGKCIQLLFPSCWKAYNLREIVLEFTSTKNVLLNHGFRSENPIFIPSKRVLIKEINEGDNENEIFNEIFKIVAVFSKESYCRVGRHCCEEEGY